MGCNNCLTNDTEEIYNFKRTNGLFRFINESGECYINSFLQILLHNTLFLNVINSIEIKNEKMQLINELLNIIKKSQNEDIFLNPTKIKDIMISLDDSYHNNGGDLNILISDFINELSTELPKSEKYSIKFPEDEITKNALNKLIKKFYSKKNSEFTKIFYGNTLIEYTCKNSHLINAKFMIFITINLSIYPFINKDIICVEEILENNFKIRNTDRIKYCEICKEEVLIDEAEYIYNLPNIIILYFPRIYDEKYYNNKIKFTKDLDFKNYLKKKDYDNPIYHLFGVIQNIHGHFNSATINNFDNNWYFFNDLDEPLLKNIEEIYKLNPIALFYSK